MYRDKKGAECTVCFSIGLQVGDYVEPMNNLVRVLVERGVPTAAISDAFGISGREVWRGLAADPISLFGCLECSESLSVRDMRDVRHLLHALDPRRPGR
jgi:hypothetical protein